MTHRAYYDHEPQKLEAVGNGSYLYRHDIIQEDNAIPMCGIPRTHSKMELLGSDGITADRQQNHGSGHLVSLPGKP